MIQQHAVAATSRGIDEDVLPHVHGRRRFLVTTTPIVMVRFAVLAIVLAAHKKELKHVFSTAILTRPQFVLFARCWVALATNAVAVVVRYGTDA